MSNKSIYAKPTYFYTYQIFNTKTGKFYIGVRQSKGDPIKDLSIRYFSSSRDKDFIADQKLNPQDYEYTVLNLFPTRKEAIAEEIFLHNLYNISQNKRFYNKAKQSSTGFDMSGIEHSEETKQKMSESRKGTFTAKDAKTGKIVGRVNGDDTRVLSGELVAVNKGTFTAKDAKTGKNTVQVSINDTRVLSGELVGVNKNKPKSEEHKQKISEALKGKFAAKNANTGENVGLVSIDDPRVLSGELLHASKCKTLSDETKQKIGKATKNSIWIYNSELEQTKRIKSNEHIPGGWIRGRKMFK